MPEILAKWCLRDLIKPHQNGLMNNNEVGPIPGAEILYRYTHRHVLDDGDDGVTALRAYFAIALRIADRMAMTAQQTCDSRESQSRGTIPDLSNNTEI